MKKYLIYIVIFCVLLFLFGVKIFNSYNAFEFVFLNYNGFEVVGDEIVGCSLNGGNVVIPREINGVEIKRIGNRAFEGLNINNVSIPDSIVSIGDYAFANNNIKSLNIPSSVKEIGEGAFIHNNISSLEIGENIKLGSACFNDNNFGISDAFFYNNNELISYGGSIKGNIDIPDVLVIGEKAFYETYIVSVSIPDTVTTIKDDAFKNNYLVELYLSNNIKFISESAFSNNVYLSEIIVDNSVDVLSNYPWGASYSNLFWLK